MMLKSFSASASTGPIGTIAADVVSVMSCDIGGGRGGKGGKGNSEDFVYGSDIPSLPTHWKPMTEMSARFSIFHIDSYLTKITANEAAYVYKILRKSFRWLDFDDFDGELECGNGGAFSTSDVKRRLSDAARRATWTQPLKKSKSLVSTKTLEKKDFYDLTMTDSEVDECLEEELVMPVEKKIGDKGDSFAVDARPSAAMLRVLGAIVRTMGLNRLQRLVEVHQLQNFESWEMYRSFHVIHRLVATDETVYHGTTFDALDGITREGIRGLYSKRSAYGRGTYVTRDFDVACSWATRDVNNLKHIIVLRCQVGSVKQVGSSVTEHDFYGPNEQGKNVLFNTKEVEMLKYLITGSDAQLVAEAIVTIEEMDPPTARQFNNSLASSVSPYNHSKSDGKSASTNLSRQDNNTHKFAAVLNRIAAINHKFVANAIGAKGIADIMSNSKNSKLAGNSFPLTAQETQPPPCCACAHDIIRASQCRHAPIWQCQQATQPSRGQHYQGRQKGAYAIQSRCHESEVGQGAKCSC